MPSLKLAPTFSAPHPRASFTQRVTDLPGGAPLEFTRAYCRGDKYKYDFVLETKGGRE